MLWPSSLSDARSPGLHVQIQSILTCAAKSGAFQFQGLGRVQTLQRTGVHELNKAIDRADDLLR